MGLLDKARALISGEPSRPSVRADYMRGGRGVVFQGWKPSLREDKDAVKASWDAATARATDIIHNSGWISGAIDQAISNVVGTGLRLKAMPEYEQLGMSDQQGREWARMVEQRWELWTRSPLECDIEGRRNFGQMQGAAFRSWFATGEIFAEIPWRKRGQYGTKIRLLPPSRFLRKDDISRNIIQGVRMDEDGFPLGYLINRIDPITGTDEIEVPARDSMGRARVVHVYDGAVGTIRGITPLVPALQVARQFDQLADATLTAAIIQTVFAATIKSDEPTEEMLQGLLTPQEQARMMAAGASPMDAWFEAQSGWYQGSTINMGINGRIAHLFPGQEMEFHSPSNPQAAYKDFSMHLLREIARCLGMTYESATGDYDGATYSSVRMATHEVFQITQYRRKNIVAPLCQAAYEAWLEEEIEAGNIPFPNGVSGFMFNKVAACRAEWRGTPKPQADDNKIAAAHQTWRSMNVMSDEMIANDLGVDIEDVYIQLAREKKMREQYGIENSPSPQEMQAINGQMNDQNDEDTDQMDDEDVADEVISEARNGG